MADDVIRAAYTARAEDYTALLGSMDAVQDADRQLVSQWAARLEGRLVDAGCGPGQWTDFLAERGADAEGVDLVPAFVELARRRFPARSYRVGSVADLGLPDGSVAGILAWYSLIHHEPEEVPVVLAELARCIRPGGGLAIGFLPGQRRQSFPHAVTPAYFWPVDQLVELVENAGFAIDEVQTRANRERPDRPYGAILASRHDR